MLIHHYLILKELETSQFLGSHLLHMYFRCESPEDGFAFYRSMSDMNVYSWNHLMEAYIDQREIQRTVELFDRMQSAAVLPNKFTFVIILRALYEKPVGVNVSRIHVYIRNSGLGDDNVINTALLRIHGEGCRMSDATKLFNSLTAKDVIFWTAMISLYAKEGQLDEAFHLFDKMQHQYLIPTTVTFVSLLSVCAKHTALNEGSRLHTLIVAEFPNLDIALNNALVNMYGRCDCLDDACSVFDNIVEKNVVTWTSMITLYDQKGYGRAGILLFHRMQAESIMPNQFSFVGAIVACACLEVLDEGKHVHTQVAESGGVDAVAGAALLNMYEKCSKLEDAEKIFNAVATQDQVLWNAMISVYTRCGKLREAIKLLECMREQGLRPDKVTFSNIFNACGAFSQKLNGEYLHTYMMESDLEPELILGNSLVRMYAHCGDIEHSRQVFDGLIERDVVSWTLMIAVYATSGQSETMFYYFDQMQQEGQLPDKVTYISVLDSFRTTCLQTHWKRLRARLESSDIFHRELAVQNALITLFGKWGNLHDAERIFTKMAEHDVVTWNALIALYGDHGEVRSVFKTFRAMLDEDVNPNTVTFITIVSACASQAHFIEAKIMHMWAVEGGFHTDNTLATALLTTYGKCGSIEDARSCFDLLKGEQNLLAWNAIIAVHAQHGQAKEAIEIFQQMEQARLIPDSLSFLALLVACSHAGLPHEARRLFTMMVHDYDILPSADHCGCLIDLFGRTGRLDEAETLLHSVPSQSQKLPFATMLGACKSENNEGRGERVAKYALESNSHNPVYYVILTNIQSALLKHGNDFSDTIGTSPCLSAVES
ncbi:hypothetical protein KP509_06G036400 [Ceratopteris richardii]|nr:hypothetical protein KP509_06G036400 [Ceratopteris richardii]